MSPMQKSSASAMPNPSKPFKTMLNTIAFGTTTAAFCISSDMWIAPSAPKKAYTLPSSPTKKESPSVGHFTPLMNVRTHVTAAHAAQG